MQKLIINLGEYKGSKNKNINGEQNFYELLINQILKMRIKHNHLLIEPDFSRINIIIEVLFEYKKKKYSVLVNGKNKTIIARSIVLTNIYKIPLSFLENKLEELNN